MIGYPFDSKVTYDADGKPSYDRAITSAPLRSLYDKLFTTGIMPNPSDCFQVVAGDGGMTVKVNPGFAVVKGCLKLEETMRTLEVQAASSSLDRIDTVVLRMNDEVNARICDLYVRQGIAATSPTRPDLVRSGSVYEIGLADIFIPKNTTTISQQRITDTRLETERCGYVSSVSQFDTDTLYLQIQSDLADFKANEQEEFLKWFNIMQEQLSEDAAGNLQQEIGVLQSLKTDIKTSIVNAINWVKDKLDEIVEKIGSNDISSIGDGTLTGGLSALNSNLVDVGKTCCFRQSNTSNVSNGYCPVNVQEYNDDANLYKADSDGVLITKPGTYLVVAHFHIAFFEKDDVTLSVKNSIKELLSCAHYDYNYGYTKQLQVTLPAIVRVVSGEERVLLHIQNTKGSSYIYDWTLTSQNRIAITKIK